MAAISDSVKKFVSKASNYNRGFSFAANFKLVPIDPSRRAHKDKKKGRRGTDEDDGVDTCGIDEGKDEEKKSERLPSKLPLKEESIKMFLDDEKVSNTLSPQQLLGTLSALRGKNTFFTGPQGGGKTFVLSKIKECLNNFEVNTITIAASNDGAILLDCDTVTGTIGASSIHENMHVLIDHAKKDRQKFIEADALIIDNIGRLNHRALKVLDKLLRYYRCCTLPFGGICVIASGDLAQMCELGGDDPIDNFFFDTPLWKSIGFVEFLLVDPVTSSLVSSPVSFLPPSTVSSVPMVSITPSLVGTTRVAPFAQSDALAAAMAGDSKRSGMGSSVGSSGSVTSATNVIGSGDGGDPVAKDSRKQLIRRMLTGTTTTEDVERFKSMVGPRSVKKIYPDVQRITNPHAPLTIVPIIRPPRMCVIADLADKDNEETMTKLQPSAELRAMYKAKVIIPEVIRQIKEQCNKWVDLIRDTIVDSTISLTIGTAVTNKVDICTFTCVDDSDSDAVSVKSDRKIGTKSDAKISAKIITKGTPGVVVGWGPESVCEIDNCTHNLPMVLFKGQEKPIAIKYHVWKDFKNGTIFGQIPLSVGWSVSLEKHTELTLDSAWLQTREMIVDARQFYCAFSRVRNEFSMESFDSEWLKMDKRITDKYRSLFESLDSSTNLSSTSSTSPPVPTHSCSSLHQPVASVRVAETSPSPPPSVSSLPSTATIGHSTFVSLRSAPCQDGDSTMATE